MTLFESLLTEAEISLTTKPAIVSFIKSYGE